MHYVFRRSHSTPMVVDDDGDVTNKTHENEKVNKFKSSNFITTDFISF